MKKGIVYGLLFILFFLTLNFFYIPFRMDTYTNYGFSYGIVMGQIPYRDYNLIIPLFGPFLYSLGLLINKSILFYYLEQSFLLVLFCYFLKEILKEKVWIVITAMFCPFVFYFAYCLFPGYNFLILFELVLLIYLNHFQKSDKLIGILIGICILTKHNIGIFIYLVTIIYSFFQSHKKSVIQFLYSLIPISIFLFYLLITNSLYSFINLCILNILEFSNNFQYNISMIIFTILFIIIIFIQWLKKKHNISYYYLLAYIPVAYPIMDHYHLSLLLFFALIVFIYNSNITLSPKTSFISIIIIFLFLLSYDFLSISHFKELEIQSYSNFPIELVSKELKNDYKYIIKYVKNKKVIFISEPDRTIFFTAASKIKLNHYYILYKGNQGYKGLDRIMKEIKEEKRVYFIIDESRDYYAEGNQFYTEVIDYVKKNMKCIKKLKHSSIYYKN